jgi:hypothetical protein
MTSPNSTSVISASINDCDLRANYILVCTEPNKFPQCPYEANGTSITMCKMRKPYTNTYALCCYKEMSPILMKTGQKIADMGDNGLANVSSNFTVLQECSALGFVSIKFSTYLVYRIALFSFQRS